MLDKITQFFRRWVAWNQGCQISWEKSSLQKQDMMRSRWVSWTKIANWYLNEDFNRKFNNIREKYKIYDEMRKSDAQIAATLKALKLPVEATKWTVEPAENEEWEIDDQDQEIASFCEYVLFEKLNKSWSELVEEILTMLTFWFSVFEKVYFRCEYWEWSKIGIDLKFRKQRTIERWETFDWKAWVVQVPLWWDIRDVSQWYISIPADKLLLFAHQKEWENYEWVSVLRSAYKHRYYKDYLYKFDAIRQERQAVWVPKVHINWNIPNEEQAEIEEAVKHLWAMENAYLYLPYSKEEVEVEFMDTRQVWDTKIQESIQHHDLMIARNILAQFMNLGTEWSWWSRALSEDHSDFFILSVKAIANLIVDVFNRYYIPELVRLNYDTDRIPKLKYDMEFTNTSQLVDNIVKLVNANVMLPDSNTEQYIREMLNVPKRDSEAPDELEDVELTEQQQENQDQQEVQASCCGHDHNDPATLYFNQLKDELNFEQIRKEHQKK